MKNANKRFSLYCKAVKKALIRRVGRWDASFIYANRHKGTFNLRYWFTDSDATPKQVVDTWLRRLEKGIN